MKQAKQKAERKKEKPEEYGWFYSDKVKEHFFNPKNIFKTNKAAEKFEKTADGIGFVGSPACGDGMKMFIVVEKRNGKEIIKDIKWQTYGCATAIASTSIFSEMAKGMKIEDALKITPRQIADELGGIPARKFHCSVLADKAFQEAVNDYYKKTNQLAKIKEKGRAKVLDKVLKITDWDIEHAVLEGATTLEEVQKKTKVGVHDKSCIPEVKRLIEKYKKKYCHV